MAWEWSHTNEAYSYAQAQVQAMSKRELLIILREWAYKAREDAGIRNPSFRLPPGLRKLPTDILASLVWDKAAELRTCTNGGWLAYVCPDGCHTVPFGPEDRED